VIRKLRRFSTWAPKAIATIGTPADSLEDRAIVVRLQRKPPGATVERLGRRDNAALRSQAARWAADNFDKLADPDPTMPDLNDRAADNWRPLLAIADLAGGTAGGGAPGCCFRARSRMAPLAWNCCGNPVRLRRGRCDSLLRPRGQAHR
jgi:hypothetical protein